MLKDLFKRREKTSEIPQVIFESKDLKLRIGIWLGDAVSQKVASKDIAARFGSLLKMVGVDGAKTCTVGQCKVLNPFGKRKLDNLLFNCDFGGDRENVTIQLNFGDWMDRSPEFIIDSRSRKASDVYNYFKVDSDNSIHFELTPFKRAKIENDETVEVAKSVEGISEGNGPIETIDEVDHEIPEFSNNLPFLESIVE